MRTFYVWSGSLRGTKVETEGPDEAVDRAVRENLPCVLSDALRVSLIPRGLHPMDVYYEAPYENTFPDLFDGSIDVRVEYSSGKESK